MVPLYTCKDTYLGGGAVRACCLLPAHQLVVRARRLRPLREVDVGAD